MGDLKLAGQPFRWRGDQAGEGLLVPVHEVPLGRLALDEFLPAGGLLLFELEIFDDVRRRLRHHPADVVEALAAGASADLVKVARAEDARLLPAEFAELREEHGADGHINAHAQRVRAADHLEQATLRQLLHQHAILRQQPGVVQTDPVLQPFPNFRSIRAAELEPLQGLRDRRLFLAGADVRAHEILGAFRRVRLGEMDDIDRPLAAGDEGFQRLRQRRLRIRKLQGHRPVLRRHRHRRASVQPGQFLFEEGGVAQRRRHKQEARLGQGEQRHLPGHAPLAVRVVVKLVHDHVLHRGARALAQRHIGQDLRGAAKDRRLAVHRRVAGAQPYILRPEFAAQRQPLFIHQGLDRAGIDRAPPVRQAVQMQRRGHQRFSGAGGRIQDDVLIVKEFENRLLLRRVELQVPAFHELEKFPEQGSAVERAFGGKEMEKRSHGRRLYHGSCRTRATQDFEILPNRGWNQRGQSGASSGKCG